MKKTLKQTCFEEGINRSTHWRRRQKPARDPLEYLSEIVTNRTGEYNIELQLQAAMTLAPYLHSKMQDEEDEVEEEEMDWNWKGNITPSV